MSSNLTLQDTKSNLSHEDLSNLVCGVTVFSILLVVFCFFYVLWKIYSDEQTNQPDGSFRNDLEVRRRHRSFSISMRKSNCKISGDMAPNNTPVDSVAV